MNKKLFILFLLLFNVFCFGNNRLLAEKEAETKDSPFEGDNVIQKVQETIASISISILDLKTAKAAGITEIKKGYPIEGTLSGLGSSYLRLRSWPWGNVIGQYYQNTKVKVLGESGEFYLVEVNGQQGYMHRNFVTTSAKQASGINPDYPGDTKSGGFLSLNDGVQSSNDAASGKKSVVQTNNNTSSSNTNTSSGNNTQPGGKQTGSNGKVVLTVPQQCQHKVNCPSPATACGPTALAMAMAYYNGQNVSTLATKMYTATGCTKCGSNYDGLFNAAKNNGFPNAKWNGSCTQSWVREKIKAGTPLVAHVKNHFVVIKGIDDNGNVIINDPAASAVEVTMTWTKFSAWWESKCCLVLR